MRAAHVLRGVLGMIGACLVVAAVAAAVWFALAGGAYRPKLGLATMFTGALLALTGTGLSRFDDLDARAFLGAGPGRDEPTTDGALTPIGVFLFVVLPLFVVGGLIYGRG